MPETLTIDIATELAEGFALPPAAGAFARAIAEAVRRDGIDIKPIGALAAK